MTNSDFTNNVTVKYLHAHQNLVGHVELNDISNLTGFTDREHTDGENYHLIRYVKGIILDDSLLQLDIDLTPENGDEDDSAIIILYDGITSQHINITGTTTDVSFNITPNKFYIIILIYYEYRDSQKLKTSSKTTNSACLIS